MSLRELCSQLCYCFSNSSVVSRFLYFVTGLPQMVSWKIAIQSIPMFWSPYKNLSVLNLFFYTLLLAREKSVILLCFFHSLGISRHPDLMSLVSAKCWHKIIYRMNGKVLWTILAAKFMFNFSLFYLLFFLICRVTVVHIATFAASLVKMLHTGSLLCFLPGSYHACATT